MDREELKRLWSEILRSAKPSSDSFDRLAHEVIDVYRSEDDAFRQHIRNRSTRVTESTGQRFDADNFDIDMAQAFIADEIGFTSWKDLVQAIDDAANQKYPLLFHYAIAALWRGDFTALAETIGGRVDFDAKAVEWYEKGYFTNEPETFAELFAAACWLGQIKTVDYLLDKGVDPYTGMRTGLSGFHWAASSGKLDVIKLLIERKVPMEVKSMYDSTVLGQALWSAVNEHTDDHAAIIESLIEGGAYVWPKTLEWWQEQDVPSAETKKRVADALRKQETDQTIK